MGIKGFSGSVARKNERSSGFERGQLFAAPFSPHPWPLAPCLSVFIFLRVGPFPSLLIPYPFFLSLPHPRTWHRGILNWHPCVSNTNILSLSLSVSLFLSRSPRTFFSEFESIKNRLEQRNERPPISHRIMSGAPSWPRRNANHGQAS